MANEIEWDAESLAFKLPVRIYFEDTDAGGIVYHSRFLNYCERARAEMLRIMNIESVRMMAEDHCGFAIKRARLDYIRPAHLDDLLHVETRIERLKNASVDVQHFIKRGHDMICTVDITIACMGAGERPVRIPAHVMDAMRGYVGSK